MNSIRIIQDEHRCLAAVLQAMLYLVHEIRDRGARPNFELFGAMVYYIDAFPERFHHRKEDEHLFPMVRRRHAAAAPLIERLKREHAIGAEQMRTVGQALLRYENGGAPEFRQFLAAVETYADFHWKHAEVEEKELLPLARQHLTAEDWQALDAAFSGHSDPLLGMEAETTYEALFRRIVSLIPPPLGVGPEPQAAAMVRSGHH